MQQQWYQTLFANYARQYDDEFYTQGTLGEVEFRQGDARELEFVDEFDLAMMICEAAFPLMETDEMNYRILQGACRALKPGGKLVLTTLNALFPLAAMARGTDGEAGEGPPLGDFDLSTFRSQSVLEFADDDGVAQTIHCDQRFYVPSEIQWMLETLGMTDIGVYGCELGAFSRVGVGTCPPRPRPRGS